MDVSTISDRLGSALSAAAAPPVVATPEPTPAPVATPEPAATETTTEPEIQFDDAPELNFDDEPAAPAVAAPAQPVAPERLSPEDDTKAIAELSAILQAGGAPKQIENAFMRTNRGKEQLALFKADRILKQPPEFDPTTGENRGGLGFMPTADQIKEFHRGHSDWTAMVQEFAVNPHNFATNWFSPDSQGNFREGTDQVLASIPQVIDQIYSNAEQSGNRVLAEKSVGMFRAVFAPMQKSYLDGLYARAAEMPDPAQREQIINAARFVEADMFGKFRDDAKVAATTHPESPADARMRELDERENRLNAWETKKQTVAQKEAENEVFATIDQSLNRYLEKALLPSKAGMSERTWRAAVKDFKSEIQGVIRKDPVGWREFNFKLSAARTNRGADARAAAVQAYEQLAQRHIRARYRTVLQELATDATRQNGALHATAAAAAAQTAPAANGGQAPPQSIMPTSKVARLPGEDPAEYNQRRLRAALGSPN